MPNIHLLFADAKVSASQIFLMVALLSSVAGPVLIAIGRNIIGTRKYKNQLIDEATPGDEYHDDEKQPTTPGWVAVSLGITSLLLAISTWTLFAMDGQIDFGRFADNGEIEAEDFDRMAEEGDFEDFDWDAEDVDIGERFGNNPDLDEGWNEQPNEVPDPPLDDEGFEQGNGGDPGNDLFNLGNVDRNQPQNQRPDRRNNRDVRQPPQDRGMQVPPNRGARQPPNAGNNRRPNFNNPVPNRGRPVPGRFESRKWASEEGDFQFTGRFQGMRGRTVILRSDSGVVVSYPMNKLSRNDQDWISQNGSLNNTQSQGIHRGRPETRTGVERLDTPARVVPRADRTQPPVTRNRPATSPPSTSRMDRTRSDRRGVRGRPESSDPTRVWTSADGRQRLRATYLKRLGPRVYLTRPDTNEKFSISYSKFSEPDKEWIKKFGKENSNTVNTIQLTLAQPLPPSNVPASSFETVVSNPSAPLLFAGPNCPTLLSGTTIWSLGSVDESLSFKTTAELELKQNTKILPKAICPSGKQIAGFARDQNRDWQLTIWNQSGTIDSILKEDWQGSPDQNSHICFAHRRLFVGQPDGDSINVWNTETHQIEGSIPVDERIASQIFDVTSNGQFIVYPKDGGLAVLDTTTGDVQTELALPEALPANPRVRNKSLRLLDANGDLESVKLSRNLKHVSFSTDGEQVMAILQTAYVNSIFVWTRSGELIQQTQYLPSSPAVNNVQWLGDNGWLIDTNIVDRKTGLVVAQLDAPTSSMAALSPDQIALPRKTDGKLSIRDVPWEKIQLSISSARVFHKITFGPPSELGLLFEIPGLTSEQATQIESLLTQKFAANGISISDKPKIYLDFRVSESGEKLTQIPNSQISIPTSHLIAEINHNGQTIYRADLGPTQQLTPANFKRLVARLREQQFPFYISDSGLLTLPMTIH